MKILINKKDKHFALLICTSNEDREALKILYHSNVVFGLYSIWTLDDAHPEKGDRSNEIKLLKEKIINLTGIGWLSNPKEFISEAKGLTVQEAVDESYKYKD